jgi:hypothetical protein
MQVHKTTVTTLSIPKTRPTMASVDHERDEDGLDWANGVDDAVLWGSAETYAGMTSMQKSKTKWCEFMIGRSVPDLCRTGDSECLVRYQCVSCLSPP